MSSFDDALARMKDLYTYGKEVNESNNLKTHTLEHRAVAADGVTYGIIRENSKYYIKSAPKGKETIAEAYDYLGGFCNKKDYEYSSYANALKQFELKMASINEAHDQKVNIESLNPFRAHAVLQEATDAMRDEIARQRQIMYNAAMLMNESTEIGADRKDDVVMYDGKNPEAETGKKGDEDLKGTKANPEYKGSKTNGVDKKVGPFDQGAGNPKDQLKEEASDIGDNPILPNTENWGTEGIGKGRDPKEVGWEMDGQQKVNEEENDWASKGLPSSAGIGVADTDHNNDPFTKNVNEGDEMDGEGDVEDDDMGEAPAEPKDGAEDALPMDGEAEDMEDDDLDVPDFDDEEGDDMATDTDLDAGVEDVDDMDGDVEDVDLDAELDAEGGDEDIMAQIEDLQAQIDALRAKLDGGDMADEPVDDIAGEEPDLEGDAESFADDGMGDDNLGGEDMGSEFGADLSGGDMADDEVGGEDMGDEFGAEGEDTLGSDDDLDECGFEEGMMESKQAFMNSIVESVVKQILKEDELNVFGKHPGYRKKPMELPTTGEDKNQWGEDWNDESVHSEEPFGSKIGDGDPFNNLVNAVTKDVMYQLKAGIPIEGENKKKE